MYDSSRKRRLGIRDGLEEAGRGLTDGRVTSNKLSDKGREGGIEFETYGGRSNNTECFDRSY